MAKSISSVSKSPIADLKSYSSGSIISSDQPVPSSPQLPTKARSFDDRECLRAAATTTTIATTESSASCQGAVDCSKSDDSPDKRKSSENISLQCEINEPNTNVRHEHISAVHSDVTASDTNLESSSLLSSDGGKVRCESLLLSASPPTITVMCAPCIDVILAETAAQQQTEKIDCDASDSEESAQNRQNDIPQPTVVLVECSENIATSVDDETGEQTSPIQTASNLQLTLEVKKSANIPTQQEDLSPSMDEYEECHPTSGDYQYDTIGGEMLVPGCVAPAPTPAPLIAPLAEIEIDPPDDEMPAVSGIEKQPPETTNTDSVGQTETAGSTAKSHQPQLQQHQPAHTSHAKKKRQKSTDKGKANRCALVKQID